MNIAIPSWWRAPLWLPPKQRTIAPSLMNWRPRWPGLARQSGGGCNCGCASTSSPPTNCIEACCGGGGASNCLAGTTVSVTFSGWTIGIADPSPTCHCSSFDGTYVLPYNTSCNWARSFSTCCGIMQMSASVSYFPLTDKQRFGVTIEFNSSEHFTWQSADVARGTVASCTSGWPPLPLTVNFCGDFGCICFCNATTVTVSV